MFTTLFTFLTALLLSPPHPLGEDLIRTKEFVYEEAPFVECHASSIESTKNGMVATWFGGSKEGKNDVEIWTSHYSNGKWSVPVSVANGTQYEGKRYPCWNPVLYRMPQGDLLLFYKVGPSPSTWWGMMKRSLDDGKTWSEAIRLPEGVLGPIKNKPFLASDGRLICPSSTEVSPDEGWRLHFEMTSDGGKSWAVSPKLSDTKELNAIQPSILDHGEGVLQAIARSKDGGVTHSWSYDNGRTWGAVEPLGLPNPNSGTDAVTLREGFHVLVYNHADKPTDKWSGLRSPINVAVSADGVHWENIVELERLEDGKGELSYPAVVQGEDGLLHITYTWKRRKIRHIVIDPQEILEKYPTLRQQIEERENAKALKSPQTVIFDTDTGNDIDDVLAMAMLYNYQKQGILKLLGITINKANNKTVPFISIIDNWYGNGKLPIGFIGTKGPTPDAGKYLLPVVEAKKKNGKPLFKRTLTEESEIPEAWKLQRKLLAEQADHSVTIISVGFSSNLHKLLKSEADEYSELTGYELVRRKVKRLSVMAGNFRHTNKSEYNILQDIPSAKYVFENWPTPVVVGGWEIGGYVEYPCSSIENDFKPTHPLRIGYSSYLPMPYDRPCWDLISVLVVAEGTKYGLSLSNWGTVNVDDKGCTSFTKATNGQHRILILNQSKKQELIDALVKAVTSKE